MKNATKKVSSQLSEAVNFIVGENMDCFSSKCIFMVENPDVEETWFSGGISKILLLLLRRERNLNNHYLIPKIRAKNVLSQALISIAREAMVSNITSQPIIVAEVGGIESVQIPENNRSLKHNSLESIVYIGIYVYLNKNHWN